MEHCLRLCQQYEVIDAAAFLLERVGDVGSALFLTLSSLDKKFHDLEAAVGATVSNTASSGSNDSQNFNSVLKLQEVCRLNSWNMKMKFLCVHVEALLLAAHVFSYHSCAGECCQGFVACLYWTVSAKHSSFELRGVSDTLVQITWLVSYLSGWFLKCVQENF